MTVTLAEMKQEELMQAVEVAAACFGADKKDAAAGDFQASFANYPYRPKTFVAKDGEKIVGVLQSITGYIGFNLRGFAWLGVLPEYRRQGIGRKLLTHGEDDAIRRHFNGKAGTFMLDSACDPAYYRAMGYCGESMTHAGTPILLKIHRP